MQNFFPHLSVGFRQNQPTISEEWFVTKLKETLDIFGPCMANSKLIDFKQVCVIADKSVILEVSFIAVNSTCLRGFSKKTGLFIFARLQTRFLFFQHVK